jgi:hypothetical protein
MLAKRIHLIIVVGTSLCLMAGNTFGKPIVVHKHPGRGHVIVRPSRPAPTVRPQAKIINRRPFWLRIGPERPQHHLVIIRTPYGRIIKAYPAPRSVSRFGVVERTIVRVWFTNSDGSRTAVELVKRGPGYIGPRGEWYREMPSKWRLWSAYGS